MCDVNKKLCFSRFEINFSHQYFSIIYLLIHFFSTFFPCSPHTHSENQEIKHDDGKNSQIVNHYEDSGRQKKGIFSTYFPKSKQKYEHYYCLLLRCASQQLTTVAPRLAHLPGRPNSKLSFVFCFCFQYLKKMSINFSFMKKRNHITAFYFLKVTTI